MAIRTGDPRRETGGGLLPRHGQFLRPVDRHPTGPEMTSHTRSPDVPSLRVLRLPILVTSGLFGRKTSRGALTGNAAVRIGISNSEGPRRSGSHQLSLSPLRGLDVYRRHVPGLTPRAKNCRRSAAILFEMLSWTRVAIRETLQHLNVGGACDLPRSSSVMPHSRPQSNPSVRHF